MRQAIRESWSVHVAAHALAELYATLTALPLSPRLAPGQAGVLIRRNVLDRVPIIDLGGRDYVAVVERMTGLELISGAIYDGLHV